MDESGLLPVPPHVIGPTWRKRTSGEWYLPEYTLADDVVNWMFAYLTQPSGPRAGEPFIPTFEQFRFLTWWYAVDESGRFLYRNGTLRRLKGWGKDPLLAAMSLAELSGPVAFSHVEKGKAVGTPRASAWIQVAAVSQDQTRNTFSLFPAMASRRLREEYGLEIHRTLVYSEAGGVIEAVTSSPLALEGKRPTFVVLNETQWWLESNAGHEMAGVISGNVDKAAYGACRSLSICNAHRPGEESVAERDYEAYLAIQAGEAVDNGMLYDSLEAPADTPVSELAALAEDPEAYAEALNRLRRGVEIARGDAEWLDVDTIISSILDIRNPVTESRRKFLNQVNAVEDSWIAPREWDACRELSLRPLEKGDRVTLGFDGSKSNDWTALVACRVEDSALFVLRAWNPERHGGEVPREDVHAAVVSAFATYDVVAMRADVKEFEAYVDLWGERFGRKLKLKSDAKNPVRFDMRGRKKDFALAVEAFYDAVVERTVVHDGNPILRRHIVNAVRRPTNYEDLYTIGKATKDSKRKIDAAVCAVLAFGARQEFVTSKKNRGRGVVILK
ncbi:terminase [Longimycelium tulufanense]|uniref:Terminase n=1 Tax=Longimycelium tulufanense TaxID=907463 RepID=A0A8J3FV37_9PSEU|nr:hypothetical protein [Longimycelium tulufanense]GGM64707.1 terminase [Longimycelium tulufanense]